MSTQILPKVLIITSGCLVETVVRRRFHLGDARIAQISSLEEFDQQFTKLRFDTIIVDRKMLLGPTNSVMADLQMLSIQTSSLIICETHNLSADVTHPSSAPASPPNEPNEHLKIISDSVRGIAHQSRNLLQRVQIRLESIYETYADYDLDNQDVEKIQCEFESLQELCETTRMICSPIKLDLELVSVSTVMEEFWSERSHDSEPEVELSLESRALSWIDCEEIKKLISKLLNYLYSFAEPRSTICITGTVQAMAEPPAYYLSFEATPQPSGKPPNEMFDLAYSQRIALLHDGRLEIATAPNGNATCVLRLPLA